MGAYSTIMGKAPEFRNISGWINSEPLTLNGLRGRIVFLDFWTYGCCNCQNTLPEMKKLHANYGKKGLVIIGVHTPEFPYERKRENVERAVASAGLTYPIALDSDNTTWKLYGNHYWPRQTIIDEEGEVAYEHAGEGSYREIEVKVVELLGGAKARAGVGDPSDTIVGTTARVA
ncbi:MAG TPA: redoxin domain-containing protein [Nitrososphaerales archaeon]|nr:redoxin domain-containing protein [Nitrososphaerales archaeon]